MAYLAATRDGTIGVYRCGTCGTCGDAEDYEGYQHVATLECEAVVNVQCISPDDCSVLGVSGSRIFMWDISRLSTQSSVSVTIVAETASCLEIDGAASVRNTCFNATGDRLLLDIATHGDQACLSLFDWTHQTQLWRVLFSGGPVFFVKQDELVLMSITNHYGIMLRTVDASTGRDVADICFLEYRKGGQPVMAVHSSEGWVAVGVCTELTVLRFDSSYRLPDSTFKLRGHTTDICGVHFCSCGTKFLSISRHQIRVWDLDTRQNVLVIQTEVAVSKTVYNGAKNHVAYYSLLDDNVRIHDLGAGQAVGIIKCDKNVCYSRAQSVILM
jgi:WD40 repeat protein